MSARKLLEVEVSRTESSQCKYLEAIARNYRKQHILGKLVPRGPLQNGSALATERASSTFPPNLTHISFLRSSFLEWGCDGFRAVSQRAILFRASWPSCTTCAPWRSLAPASGSSLTLGPPTPAAKPLSLTESRRRLFTSARRDGSDSRHPPARPNLTRRIHPSPRQSRHFWRRSDSIAGQPVNRCALGRSWERDSGAHRPRTSANLRLPRRYVLAWPTACLPPVFDCSRHSTTPGARLVVLRIIKSESGTAYLNVDGVRSLTKMLAEVTELPSPTKFPNLRFLLSE